MPVRQSHHLVALGLGSESSCLPQSLNLILRSAKRVSKDDLPERQSHHLVALGLDPRTNSSRFCYGNILLDTYNP